MKKHTLNQLQKKTLEQLRAGKSLFGKGGAFVPLVKRFLEQALEGEMDAHLDAQERKKGNKRNGKGRKTIKSSAGQFTIATPQDRQSSFEPQIIRKRETFLIDSLEEKILALYSLGNGYRDICRHLTEIYGVELSPTQLSHVTDRIIPDIKAWQSRILSATYPIIFLDAMFHKVKDDNVVKTKALYSVLGVDPNGYKEILGLYIHDTESSRTWLEILTDLRNRGVKEILIACTDNLKGFSEAIQSIYPKAEVQTCIVHQIRNSLKYVASKDSKEFLADLKCIYKAATKVQAEEALDALSKKWGKKYPIVIRSWIDNWERLSTYFAYTPPIRRLIYTTNAVEGYHRQIRKVTKNKGPFTSDMALLKLVYLATKRIEKKWTVPIQNWGLIAQQLAIRFGDRMPLYLTTKTA